MVEDEKTAMAGVEGDAENAGAGCPAIREPEKAAAMLLTEAAIDDVSASSLGAGFK